MTDLADPAVVDGPTPAWAVALDMARRSVWLLPVLGGLFRSRQFRDRQTELVVFVTPRFVEGMPSVDVPDGLAPMREPQRLLPSVPRPAPAPDDALPPELRGGDARLADPAGPGPRERPAAAPSVPPSVPPSVQPSVQPSVPPSAPPSIAPSIEPPAESPTPGAATPTAEGRRTGPAHADDRGTTGRWRASRERLRMID